MHTPATRDDRAEAKCSEFEELEVRCDSLEDVVEDMSKAVEEWKVQHVADGHILGAAISTHTDTPLLWVKTPLFERLHDGFDCSSGGPQSRGSTHSRG